MAKKFNSEEGGTPTKFILDKLEKVHNCYADLKNNWEENAMENESEVKKFVCTTILIFLLGFLCSQVSMFLFGTTLPEVKVESLRSTNSTVLESVLEELVDYAAESNGAVILHEYSTPEYLGWLSLFSNNRKESLISENNEPGNCWPFNGTYGFIGIHLAQAIYPKHFSIYHINSVVYSSAPKTINVYSLDHPDGSALLASYFFDLAIKGEKRKKWGIFDCEHFCDHLTSQILLEITDNYGAAGTCVYQFRVHGVTNI